MRGAHAAEAGCAGPQVAIIVRGVECISAVESFAAPVLIALTLALLGWAWHAAGGLGSVLAAPSQFAAGGAKSGQFWPHCWPLLTACVGFWGTLALNIADFTRCVSPNPDTDPDTTTS